MAKPLVIVESPAKARTIKKILGDAYDVEASIGHVRDLPEKASDVPSKLKGEAWARFGVNVDDGFTPLYIVPPKKRDQVKKLREAVAKASELYLATDEDREGESISWHLLEVLDPKIPVHRLVFHEITSKAIHEALKSPRSIDTRLVEAQETRRIVDRLYGYSVSPLLWKKVKPKLSAGRVQSVAVRLIVERERLRISFKMSSYASLTAYLRPEASGAGSPFKATLTEMLGSAEAPVGSGRKIAIGKDFDPNTGALREGRAKDALHLTEESAGKIRDELEGKRFAIHDIEEKPFREKPPSPFTTSTLQQEGHSKLRYTAQRTMQIAQRLYENGYITYMRTDSTALSDEAIRGIQTEVRARFGDEYLSREVRVYKTKVKNAQEAHEAIRPSGERFRKPESVKSELTDEEFKLYELIYRRTLACQMNDAEGTNTKLTIRAHNAVFSAFGKVYDFPGFRKAYEVDVRKTPNGEDEGDEQQDSILPKLARGDGLTKDRLEVKAHKTQPPQRYTEASLIRELEEKGIGRPSTYASIIETIQARDYVFKRGPALIPTFTAFVVTGLLEQYMGYLIDYDFTARMEDELDQIAQTDRKGVDYLSAFYFGRGGSEGGLDATLKDAEKTVDPRQVCSIELGLITLDGSDGGSGSEFKLEVRVGRYGPFVSAGELSSSIPEDIPPDELTIEAAKKMLLEKASGPRILGTDAETGKVVYAITGRFGPYVQLGDADPANKKEIKRASLLSGMSFETVDFETAMKLLALPKTLGVSDANGEPIVAASGKYGPFIKCGSDTRSVPSEYSILDLTLADAKKLLAMPPTRKTPRKATEVIRDLGEYAEWGTRIKLLSGRYGPYVTDGDVNATLPKGMHTDEITLERAVEMIQTKREAGPTKRIKRKRTKKAK
ncbi:MAG: type I DNA topoisomerase [Planctomycetes bacterium]|nr:type I DNA topoisomerase [Planctomycetota bacterium]